MQNRKNGSSSFRHVWKSLSSLDRGDDDINDVAAMGGVNLAEESQRILGSTEFVGTQIRSCKDEVFLHLAPLQQRIKQIGNNSRKSPSIKNQKNALSRAFFSISMEFSFLLQQKTVFFTTFCRIPMKNWLHN